MRVDAASKVMYIFLGGRRAGQVLLMWMRVITFGPRCTSIWFIKDFRIVNPVPAHELEAGMNGEQSVWEMDPARKLWRDDPSSQSYVVFLGFRSLAAIGGEASTSSRRVG